MLFILAAVVACISWTVTQERVFEELRSFCHSRHHKATSFFFRKLYYLPLCYYCFSHYVTLLVLLVSEFTLGYGGWRGAFVGYFTIVAVANVYLSLYNLLRQILKAQSARAKIIAERAKRIQ